MAVSRSQRREERAPRAAAYFAGDELESALDLLELVEFAWHDCYREISPPEGLIDDILLVSGGTLSGLISTARMAVTDWRDVNLAASAMRARS